METATVAKDTWTELHEAEAEFNRKKVVRAGVEAVLQNAALPAEIDALGEETAAYKNRRAKRRRERETDHERRTKCMRTHENGKHFNIAETTRAETVLAGALGMHLVDHPVRAAGGVYVVRDPAEPPETIRLVAILTGAAFIDPMYMASGGSKGSSIAHTPAVCVKRSVYASPGAVASMPDLTLVLRSIIEGYTGCKNNWEYSTVTPRGVELKSSYLAIVSAEEKSSEWATCRYAMLFAEFLDYVQKVNVSMTASGLCGH